MRRGLGTSGTTLNFPTSESQGCQKREEEEQEIENVFEQIMKENVLNMAKEIDFQEVQEAQSPKEVGPKEEHTKANHNYISQD